MFNKFLKIPKYSDPELEYWIDEFKYFAPFFNFLLRKIFFRKISNFFKFYKFTIVYVLITLMIFAGAFYYIRQNTGIKIVKEYHKDEKLYIKTDRYVTINSIVNDTVKKYFDLIAATESEDYQTVNESSDAWGRYQLIPIARQHLANMGITFSKEFFLSNPDYQDIVMYIFLKENYRLMVSLDLLKYDGMIINGYHLTIPGMLSMSHAVGAGGVKNFIESGCNPSTLPPGAPIADRRLTVQNVEFNF